MRLLRLVPLCAAVVLAGCGELPELPPMPDPVAIGETTAAPTPAPGATTLSPDGFRTTERVAVRVRNVGCDGVSTGSGFAVSEDILVTNRHVVAGADTLQVSTYDGQDLLVETAGAAVVADLAIVHTRSALPAAVTLAESDPEVGEPVEVVGYPGGGRLTSSAGTVLGFAEDPLDANAGQVVVTDAPAEPGSSGSPMYDESGQVVGVVYAATKDGTRSLAVPVSTLQTMLDQASFDDEVPPCE
ncbi:MAG TPA: trypsin-like peptidase domain-containing protein [Jiangellaceae bacterium]|nr:trypsin-like peptidase domain-containing protein [Jiangellaceae bacterium]